MESAVRRFSKLEDAAHEAQLASDVHAVSWSLIAACAAGLRREGATARQKSLTAAGAEGEGCQQELVAVACFRAGHCDAAVTWRL
jgi:hypothetical protein